jgi:uncharacterized protein (TIGR00730 family)
MNICVYCSSSNNLTANYYAAARELGIAMAQHRWPLIYGGGSVGLMGEIARAVHEYHGYVVGVIPQALLDREVGYHASDELIVTETMRQRKQTMDDRADAFVTLPGGFGTLEELLEIITHRQLGYHDKPIIIVNLNNFYDPLLQQFEEIFAQQFTDQRHRRLYQVVEDVPAAVTALQQALAG